MLINELSLACINADAIAAIKLSPQFHLLGNDLLSAFQDLREREPARLPDFPEHWVGIELNDLLNRMTEGFGWNRPPVGTVTTNHFLVFYDSDFLALFGCIHRSPFTRRACTYNDDVVMVFRHESETPL